MESAGYTRDTSNYGECHRWRGAYFAPSAFCLPSMNKIKRRVLWPTHKLPVTVATAKNQNVDAMPYPYTYSYSRNQLYRYFANADKNIESRKKCSQSGKNRRRKNRKSRLSLCQKVSPSICSAHYVQRNNVIIDLLTRSLSTGSGGGGGLHLPTAFKCSTFIHINCNNMDVAPVRYR